MGCTSSSGAAGNRPPGPAKRKSKKSSKDEDPQEIPDEEVHKMKEDILQRHDSEVDIISQISAEREALKIISTVKIERKYSCEDLLEFLDADLLNSFNDDPGHFSSQKRARAALMQAALARKDKRWVILNNLDAISNESLATLATFLLRIIRAMQKPENHPPAKDSRAGSQFKSLDSMRMRQLGNAIRSMNVVSMTPASAFSISPDNLYDFDLPPGLITMHEARLLIEVFRQGGKLLPRAVHKLLRLSYRLLKDMPNTTHVTVRPQDKLTVVGDIHGQLADLFHILDAAGLPSATNKYIFNGDFVDRGPHGVEVMCVLLALFVARPDCVALNRGNHEDFAICSVYGFQLECYEKYDPLTFGLFVEVFQQIPLFVIVNQSIFVVHGGLFHSESATLEELNAIDRTAFTLEEIPEDGETLDAVGRGNYKAFLQQLIRDALWSDPVNIPGKHPSARGAGVSFGPDVVEKFLLNNNLKFVIRSHECVRSGYDEPFTTHSVSSPIGGAMLCTIFSASDYGGSGNSAAYLEFSVSLDELPMESPKSFKSLRSQSMSMSRQHSVSDASAFSADNMSELKRVEGTNLLYTVHYFYANPLHFTSDGMEHREAIYDLTGLARDLHGVEALAADEALARSRSGSADCGRKNCSSDLLIGSTISVEELICVRKQLLLDAFERGDRIQEGHVSQQFWLRAMTDVLNVSFSWRRVARFIIGEEMTAASSGKDTTMSDIKYIDFLNSFDDDIIFARREDEFLAQMRSLEDYPGAESPGGAHGVGLDDVKLEESPMTSPLCLQNPGAEGQSEKGGQYYGHVMSPDLVSALYSNHERVEEAFLLFDTDGDNCFDVHDMLAGCAQLGLLAGVGGPVHNNTYKEEDVRAMMDTMDVFKSGCIDINVFFEMFRLSLLNTSFKDDAHWTKPLLTRELSHAHELYRLSHSLVPTTPVPSMSMHPHGILPSQLSGMGLVELRKGVEIGVDSELLSANADANEQVGLSIDI